MIQALMQVALPEVLRCCAVAFPHFAGVGRKNTGSVLKTEPVFLYNNDLTAQVSDPVHTQCRDHEKQKPVS